ncbi:hypothetical protein ES706_00200 [subsurface metagenome]
MTKKSVKFKMEINKRLNKAAEWWGVKQKVGVIFVENYYAITDYGVTPYLMEKDKAPVCVFTDAWKNMGEAEKWYFCYHEVGHIKYFYDGYPVPVLEADEVNYPQIFNVVRVFPEQVLSKYSEVAVPLYKDMCERHMDHLITYTLASAFKPEMHEAIRWMLQKPVKNKNNFLIPPTYLAFLLVVDYACYRNYYELADLSDKEIEGQILKGVLKLEKDLPNAKEVFERAKGIISEVRFSTDINTITKWILEMYSLMPEIDFKAHNGRVSQILKEGLKKSNLQDLSWSYSQKSSGS